VRTCGIFTRHKEENKLNEKDESNYKGHANGISFENESC
jgi:hypothetical protein